MEAMEQLYEDILNVGYSGEADKKEIFITAFNDGSPNMLFVDIITWLSSELAFFCNTESRITPYENKEDIDGIGFMVEISSLLKELNCPIKRLNRGPLENRLNSSQDKMNVMMYLCLELQAAKINHFKKPKKQLPVKIELEESNTAKELKEMLISLSFGKPPANITPHQLFGEVEKKIKHLSHPASPKEFVGERLFTGYLTEKQWFQIDTFFKEIFEEYKIRRSLLLTRLNVTIESFLWSDKKKARAEELRTCYEQHKKEISDYPSVKISDILAASPELAVIQKTSDASVRKNIMCSIYKVKIGQVPDRGGRPEEQQPPPPEIPSWQKNEPSRGGMRNEPFRGGMRNESSRGGMRNEPSRGGMRNDRQGDSYRQSDRSRQFENPKQTDRFRQDKQNNQSGYTQTRDFNPSYREPEKQPLSYMNVQQDHNPIFNPTYGMSIGNPQPVQFGFGGYGPASDHYAQYGAYQPAPSDGDAPQHRGRGGGFNRGTRPYRGHARGRQRY